MTRQFHALERSLHDGPPDESGYDPAPLALSAQVPARGAGRLRIGEPITGRRGVRVDRRGALVPSSWVFAVMLLAISLGGVALLSRSDKGSGANPSAVGTPPPTSGASFDAHAITVPPLTQTFVSDRHGFSVDYPLGWVTKRATIAWQPDTFLNAGNRALDELSRAGNARLTVASQPIGAGVTEDEWVAADVRPYGQPSACSPDLASALRLPIDGRSGYLNTNGCPAGSDSTFSVPDMFYNAIVFAGDRVYTIGFDGNVDLAYFQAILATMHLDPAAALN